MARQFMLGLVIVALVAIIGMVSVMMVKNSLQPFVPKTLVGEAANPPSLITQDASEGGSIPSMPLTQTGPVTYVYGKQLIASSKSGDVTYFAQDSIHTNDISMKRTGELASKTKTYPFGKSLSRESKAGNVNKWTFTGKEDDGKQMYFGARYYDPRIARFTGVDAIQTDSSSYEYSLSNPLRFIDPQGMQPVQNVPEPNIPSTPLLDAYFDSPGLLFGGGLYSSDAQTAFLGIKPRLGEFTLGGALGVTHIGKDLGEISPTSRDFLASLRQQPSFEGSGASALSAMLGLEWKRKGLHLGAGMLLTPNMQRPNSLKGKGAATDRPFVENLWLKESAGSVGGEVDYTFSRPGRTKNLYLGLGGAMNWNSRKLQGEKGFWDPTTQGWYVDPEDGTPRHDLIPEESTGTTSHIGRLQVGRVWEGKGRMTLGIDTEGVGSVAGRYTIPKTKGLLEARAGASTDKQAYAGLTSHFPP